MFAPSADALRRFVFGGLTLVAGSAGLSQAPPLHAHFDYQLFDSGSHTNSSPVAAVVWQQLVVAPPATPWLRVFFQHSNLPAGSLVRIVALRDGAEQRLRQEHVEQWNYGSAFFNGNVVLVEIEAAPGTIDNRIVIDRLWVGDDPATVAWPESICGGTDDRIPGSHPAIGRTDLGCTGWIINQPPSGNDKCHLTAGHCFPGSNILEFWVPQSNANCSIVHPHPNNQFAINLATKRFVNQGVGNDYAVFRCFYNPNTNLSTYQTQGAQIVLAPVIPGIGVQARVTGFGTDGSEANNAPEGDNCTCVAGNGTGRRNQIQQTHDGPITAVGASSLSYRLDTCGGNSGSPVFEDGPINHAIAIHTHGGCLGAQGSNEGTLITKPALRNAILAVCGMPGGGGTITNDLCLAPVTIDLGTNGPFHNLAATNSLPAWPCGNGGSDVWYRFTASATAPHTFSTCTTATMLDTVLEVFAGACSALSSLGCNDDACGTGSSLLVSLQQGQTYLVRVGGKNGAQGTFELTALLGTGLGTLTNVATGCGNLTLQVTGSPNLGSTLFFTLGGVQGIPFLRLGFQQLNQQICAPAPCRLGPASDVGLVGSNHALSIPGNAAFLGLMFGVQAADLLAPGGCVTIPIVLSDTIRVTVG